jgi:hypothetical protein
MCFSRWIHTFFVGVVNAAVGNIAPVDERPVRSACCYLFRKWQATNINDLFHHRHNPLLNHNNPYHLDEEPNPTLGRSTVRGDPKTEALRRRVLRCYIWAS